MSVNSIQGPKPQGSTATQGPKGPAPAQAAPAQTSNAGSGSTSGPRDTVQLSRQAGSSGSGATAPVDPGRQDAEAPAQEQRIEDQKEAAATPYEKNVAEATRPATGEDAERYNGLVAEAASYEPGSYETDRGHVEVSEENGVKTLRYSEGDTQRVVTVDSTTGSASERTTQAMGRYGMPVTSDSVEFHREGDHLAPVVDQKKLAWLQFQDSLEGTQGTQAPTQSSSSPQTQEALRDEYLQALQDRIREQQQLRDQLRQPPSWDDYLRG